MKKKFWTARLKTILIIALVVAICAAVTLAIATDTSVLENVVGTILSPVRAGVASIDRLAQRYYDYMFRYASLEAENAEMEKQILAPHSGIGAWMPMPMKERPAMERIALAMPIVT